MKPKTRARTVRLIAVFLCLLFSLAGFSAEVQAAGLGGVKKLHQTASSSSSFKVAWEKDPNAQAYELQYSPDKKNWSSSTYHHSLSEFKYPLNSGRSYYVKVRSFNSCYPLTWRPTPHAVFSDWCDAVEVVTAPEPVTYLQQTNGSSSSITVKWAASEGANRYAVYYVMGGSQFRAGETSETSYVLNGLSAGTRYSIRVYPVRLSGSGYAAVGNYASHDCFTAAKKVTGLSYHSWNTSENIVSLDWDSISSYTVSGYELQITTLSGQKAESIQTLASCAEFKPSSSKNQGFRFKVRAYKNIDGTPIYGDWSNAKIIVAQPKITLKKKGGSVQINWKKTKGAASYTIYRSSKSGGTFKKIKTVKANKYTDSKINAKKTYYYYVVANKVKVKGKAYKSTKAQKREVAYLNAHGRTRYYYY